MRRSFSLRGVLDDATGCWGMRVNHVELNAIDPAVTIQEAMEKQMPRRAGTLRQPWNGSARGQATGDPGTIVGWISAYICR